MRNRRRVYATDRSSRDCGENLLEKRRPGNERKRKDVCAKLEMDSLRLNKGP